MPDPVNDLRGALSEMTFGDPIVHIGQLLANSGQDVLDAWEKVKDHVNTLVTTPTTVRPQAQATSVATSSAQSPPASNSTQKYRVELSDGRVFDVETEGGPPSEQDIVSHLNTISATPKIPEKTPATPTASGLPMVDVPVGMAKGALSTARGVAGLVMPQGWQEGLSAVRQRMGLPSVSELTQPTNAAQSIGKGVEQIGEFFVPELAVNKFAPAASALMKAVTFGGSNAALAKAQGSGPVGTTVAGALGALGPLTQLSEGAMQWAATKIEKGVLKAGTRDYQNGFNPANVFRYGLGGSVGDTYQKASQKLSELGQQLKQILQNAPGHPSIDMTTLRQRVLGSWRNNPDAANAVDRIEKAIQFRLNGQGLMPRLVNGRVTLDLADANTAKQAVGDLGAWLTDPTGKVVSDADKMTEAVANRYYALLREQIQTQAGSAGKEIQALNQQMADIIPIRSAALRRFPIEDRHNLISLVDALSVAGGHVPLGMAHKLATTGQAANFLATKGATLRTGAIKAAQIGSGLASEADR